jgi:hypothetical protein
MERVISYSGGLGSFLCAERVQQQHPEDPMTLLFLDTKTEDEDLYRFLGDSSDYLKTPVTTVADGRDIWEVFNDVRYMGNNRRDPCSKHLKRDLAKKWMKEHHKPEEATLYVGIGWEEVNRLEAIQNNWAPFQVLAPMVEPPFLTRKGMMERLRSLGLEPPRLYALGFPHNNCGGFCIKTGQAQFKLLLKTFPDRYRHHEEQQEKLFEKIGHHGTIRLTRDGNLEYLSMKQFREHLEAKRAIDEFDFGGCGCFA